MSTPGQKTKAGGPPKIAADRTVPEGGADALVAVEHLIVPFEKNAVVRGLIQSIPIIGPIADNFIVNRRNEEAVERFNEFVDELDRQGCDITEVQLHDRDFFHAVLVTVSAATRARRREKVRLFARMLSNYHTIILDDEDAYEEQLSILDEMSARELQVLLVLRDCERAARERYAAADDVPFMAHWPEFVEKAKALSIPTAEIVAFLRRLSRTGLCHLPSAGLGVTGEQAETTPSVDRFIAAIEDHPVYRDDG